MFYFEQLYETNKVDEEAKDGLKMCHAPLQGVAQSSESAATCTASWSGCDLVMR